MNRIAKGAALVALAAIASACEQTPPTPDRPPSAGLDTPAEAAPVEIGRVVWPPDEQIDRAALAALPPPAAAAVRISEVPVLVPPRPALLAAATIIAKPNWTTFSAGAEGITVSVMATRLAHRYDHIPPARGTSTVRGQPAFVTQNEGIWSVTWMENGVSYTVDLECASHEDAACASEAAVLELAGALAYVGGAGAGGGAR